MGSSFVFEEVVEAGDSSDGDTPSPSLPSEVVVESFVKSFVLTDIGVLVSVLMVR